MSGKGFNGIWWNILVILWHPCGCDWLGRSVEQKKICIVYLGKSEEVELAIVRTRTVGVYW